MQPHSNNIFGDMYGNVHVHHHYGTAGNTPGASPPGTNHPQPRINPPGLNGFGLDQPRITDPGVPQYGSNRHGIRQYGDGEDQNELHPPGSTTTYGGNTFAVEDWPIGQENIDYTQFPPELYPSNATNAGATSAPLGDSDTGMPSTYSAGHPNFVYPGEALPLQPAGNFAGAAMVQTQLYQDIGNLPMAASTAGTNTATTDSFDQASLNFPAPGNLPPPSYTETDLGNASASAGLLIQPNPDNAAFAAPPQQGPALVATQFQQSQAPAGPALQSQGISSLNQNTPSILPFDQTTLCAPAAVDGPPPAYQNISPVNAVTPSTNLIPQSHPVNTPFSVIQQPALPAVLPPVQTSQAPNATNRPPGRRLCTGKLRQGVRTPCPEQNTVWKWVGNGNVRRCFDCLGNKVPLSLRQDINARQEQGIEPCSNCYHRNARGDGGGLCQEDYESKQADRELRKEGQGKGRKRKHQGGDDVLRGGPGGPPPKKDDGRDDGFGPAPPGAVGAVFSGIDMNPGVAY